MTTEVGQEPEFPTGGAEGRPPRFHIPFYDDVLKIAEIWLLVVLLLAVIAATFLNILDRNFQLGLWDYAVVEKMIYSAVFYIGVFGGVVASRRAKHIAIDAVTHFIRPRARLMLGAVLQLVCAGTCIAITYACYEWIQTVIAPESALLPAHDEWYLNTRLWRWPIVIGFGLMALHFGVNAIRFTVDALRTRDAI